MSRFDKLGLRSRSLDPRYLAAVELIWPFLHLGNRPSRQTFDGNEALRSGIGTLKAVYNENSSANGKWAILWLMGKAYEALDEHENSYLAFQAASKLNSSNIEILRELAASCLKTGKNQEAILVARAAVKLASDNASLVANLAVALLVNNQLNDALRVAQEALALSPSDPRIKTLLPRIESRIAETEANSIAVKKGSS